MVSLKEQRKSVKDIFDQIRARLDELDEVRNEVLKEKRNMLTLCRKAMNLIHSGEISEAQRLALRVKGRIKDIEGKCRDKEAFCLISNILRSVKQELVEVLVLLSLIKERSFPNPAELGIDTISYALGVADTIGELRREVLIAIEGNRLKDAERLLWWMQALLEEISQLAYPDSLVPIRHKIDVARSLFDKTLSELLFYKKSSSL